MIRFTMLTRQTETGARQQILTQSQPSVTAAGAPTNDAPPKQAGRVIADIRLGVDRVLEALFVSSDHHQTNTQVNLFVKEDAAIRHHLQDLHAIGWKLEESGVLNESLLSRICRLFAQMVLLLLMRGNGSLLARLVHQQLIGLVSPLQELHCGSLSGVLKHLEKEVPQMKIYTHQRLEWLKKAVALSSSSSLNEKLRTLKHLETTAFVLHLQSYYQVQARALISLHSAGSMDPNAVSFFSPDERGSYVHPRGVSAFHVFKHVTEQAAIAMQFFLSSECNAALYLLLVHIILWAFAGSALTNRYSQKFAEVITGDICTTVITENFSCSKCGRLLSVDQQSVLLLPPVNRPFRQFSFNQILTEHPSSLVKDHTPHSYQACHIGCPSEEM
ncbi:hypothetical protein QQ045_007711 [Rhodiola kirilowii]